MFAGSELTKRRMHRILLWTAVFVLCSLPPLIVWIELAAPARFFNWLLPVTMLFPCYLIILFMLELARNRLLPTALSPLGRFSTSLGSALIKLALLLLCVELGFRVALNHELQTNSSSGSAKVYRTLFQPVTATAKDEFTYNLMYHSLYVMHHHLNYALNPNVTYANVRQFHNEPFHIRRTESLRPRKEVDFRAVILGGSTTWDTQIDREEETWVYGLEQLERAKHGQRIDIINGGVGGYTLYDNFIHYFTLLSYLNPDVVILYVGINDVSPRLSGALQPDYSNYRVPFRSALFPPLNDSLIRFSTYRYYYYKTNIDQPLRRGGIDAFATNCGNASDPPKMRQLLKQNGPEIFTDLLANFVGALKAQGRMVIILPQYFLPRSAYDEAFGEGVTQHNDICRHISKRFGVQFVEEILANGTFDMKDTNDSCHFNPAGAQKMSQLVFRHLDQCVRTSDHHTLPKVR